MSSNESSRSAPTAHLPSSQSTADLGPVKKVEADDAVGIGQLIDNRYRITKKLGEGGMGEVYAAEHIHIEKKVAIKLLRSEILDNPEAVQRFYQEARSASSIGHENIIAIEDFGKLPDRRIYLCMELLEGQPLNDMLEQEIAPDRMLDILIQTCHGLAAAHKKGIVHRDMKPDNIFVTRTPDGRDVPKLLDFGIAKVQGTDGDNNLTRTGTIFGTPFYMAPEQALGQGIDHRADIYAMGVIMYEVFTGSVPYQGDSFMAILTKRITSDPDPPEQRAAQNGKHLLPGIAPIIERAMKREVSERYQTMDELTADLVSLRRSIVGAGMSAYMEPHMVATISAPLSAVHPVHPTPVPGPHHTPVPMHPAHTPPHGSSAALPISHASASSSSVYSVDASSSFAAMPKKGSKAGLIAALIIVLVVAGGIAGFVLMSGKKNDGEVAANQNAPVTNAGSQTGDTNTGDTITGDTNTADTKSGDIKTSDTKAGDTKTGDTGTGDPGNTTVITPAPTPVKVLVNSKPPGAMIKRGGEELGPTPLNVDVIPGQPVTITLEKSRYHAKEVVLDGTTDRTEIKLTKRRSSGGKSNNNNNNDTTTGDLGLGLE